MLHRLGRDRSTSAPVHHRRLQSRILCSDGAKDLIAGKVRFLVAKEFLSSWPTPIVIVTADIGAAVTYPAASIEKDFSWAPNHSVVAAYRACQPMPYDAQTTSMAAALYAVNPGAPYFKLSEDGKVRKLLLDPEQKKAIRAVYTELASGKPLPKPHFGPPNVEEVKPDRAPDKNQDCSQWWMPGTMPQPIAF